LSAGQLNAPLALAYPLFWWALTRRKSWLAGFVGAFAALFKLSPGILALYLLWTRRWRALGWMALWGALLLGASTAAAGPRLQWAFLPVLREMGYGRSTDAELAFYREPANQSFNSLFHHLFAPWEGFEPLWALGPGVADAATRAASFALLALVLWISRPRQAARNERAEALCFSLFIFLSLLLPSLCWDHYFVQLFFPVLAVWDALRRGGGRGSLAAPLALCAGCLAYLALPHLPSLARMGDPFWLPPALGALAAGWMFRGRRDWALGALFLVALCIVSFPFYFAADAWKTGVGALAMSWKLWGALGLFAAAAWLCVEGGEREGADAARAWAER